MKKIIVAGLFAISLIAISQQQASAWFNSRLGMGLNMDFQSGGNSALWGAWRNGQPPGPEAFGGGGHHQGGHGGFPRFGGQFQHGQHGSAPQGFAPQGFAPQAYPQVPQSFAPQGYPPMQQGFAPMPPAAYQFPTAEPPIAARPMYYNSPYQFANYPRPVYYYYPTPYYGQ